MWACFDLILLIFYLFEILFLRKWKLLSSVFNCPFEVKGRKKIEHYIFTVILFKKERKPSSHHGLHKFATILAIFILSIRLFQQYKTEVNIPYQYLHQL